ncbi:hypothetical protein TNCV_1288941 [Trichonephila clavipes]|nr:hypothetical protein TNCV_1288941 [Trichonephila clavipes]
MNKCSRYLDSVESLDHCLCYSGSIRAVQEFLPKSPSEGPFPFLVTLLRRLGIPRCDWASVEDLGSVCIEHMILSCLGESSCP